MQPAAYYDEHKNPISAPSLPGSYFVELQLTEMQPAGILYDTYVCRSDLIPFAITPVNITAIENINGDKTYDGAPVQLSFTAKNAGGESWVFTDGVCADCPKTPVYSFKKLGDSQFASGLPVNAGAWQVKIDLGDVSQTATVTVEKAVPAADDFLVTPPHSLVYNGAPKEAAVEVAPHVVGMGEVTVVYYQNGRPVQAPVTVGAYSVFINVAEGGNYTALSDLALMDFTLRPAEARQVVFPTAQPLLLGTALQESALENGFGAGSFAWAQGDEVPPAGEIEREVVFTPLDAENYDYASMDGWDAENKVLRRKVKVLVGAAPVFSQPAENVTLSLFEGETAKLSVTVAGADALRWYRVPAARSALPEQMPGAVERDFATQPMTLADSGVSYYCEAENLYGVTQSPLFTLQVARLPSTGDEAPLALWLLLMGASWLLIKKVGPKACGQRPD